MPTVVEWVQSLRYFLGQIESWDRGDITTDNEDIHDVLSDLRTDTVKLEEAIMKKERGD